MRIVDGQKKDLLKVKEITRNGDALVIKGKLFGTMPVTAQLTPEEARKAFKLMAPGMLWFLLTFLLRRTEKKPIEGP